MNKTSLTGFLLLLCSATMSASTWLVGPTHTYTKPSLVASVVQNGDTILIDAGIYPEDVARWTANNLLIRGVDGLAHLKSGGKVYGQKAIWVITGDDVTVENIEFSEAVSIDLNGAGIRSEGINLTIRGCYFHENENGILAGDIASGDFLIEHCEFEGNGYTNGLAHNLYINHANSLIFRYNYSHDAKVGHELKSRAYNNYIYCNRFSDEAGTASRNIDLPNGGFSIIMGNLIVQDLQSQNSNLFGYGLEGLSNPNSALYVIFNTFVNNKNVGSFVQVANGTPILKAYNNIFAGPGTIIAGSPSLLDSASNATGPISAFQFVDPANYDFQLQAGSIAAGIATDAGMVGNYLLSPMEEYVHPSGFKAKPAVLDAGAFSFSIVSPSNEAFFPKISLFPNPATNVLMVTGIDDPLATFGIIDMSGKTLKKDRLAQAIDISRLDPGIFVLSILSKGRLLQQLFIKN